MLVHQRCKAWSTNTQWEGKNRSWQGNTYLCFLVGRLGGGVKQFQHFILLYPWLVKEKGSFCAPSLYWSIQSTHILWQEDIGDKLVVFSVLQRCSPTRNRTICTCEFPCGRSQKKGQKIRKPPLTVFHQKYFSKKSNGNIVKHFILAKYHEFWRMWSIPDLWHHMNSHSRLPSSRLVGLLVLDLRTIPNFFEALSEGLDWLWSSEVVCRYAIYGMMVAIYFYNLQTFDLHNQLYNALYIMGLSRWILTVNHWRLTVLDSLVWLISKLFSHIHPSI